MTQAPATLEHTSIAARVPHSGAMCLLDAVLSWTTDDIDCRIVNHADPRHPLRLHGVLPSASALEYASQAMALHGSLCAPAHAAPTPGFVASARDLRLHVARLDDAPGPLRVRASRLAGAASQAMYRFELHDARQRLLVEGRATVVLNAAPATVPAPASPQVPS
jgi:predicted hotdog family 3-hydroxylacyl-ACP dehydratase